MIGIDLCKPPQEIKEKIEEIKREIEQIHQKNDDPVS
jgi:hypothetical protein